MAEDGIVANIKVFQLLQGAQATRVERCNNSSDIMRSYVHAVEEFAKYLHRLPQQYVGSSSLNHPFNRAEDV